jgi:hypothetical protein
MVLPAHPNALRGQIHSCAARILGAHTSAQLRVLHTLFASLHSHTNSCAGAQLASLPRSRSPRARTFQTTATRFQPQRDPFDPPARPRRVTSVARLERRILRFGRAQRPRRGSRPRASHISSRAAPPALAASRRMHRRAKRNAIMRAGQAARRGFPPGEWHERRELAPSTRPTFRTHVHRLWRRPRPRLRQTRAAASLAARFRALVRRG